MHTSLEICEGAEQRARRTVNAVLITNEPQGQEGQEGAAIADAVPNFMPILSSILHCRPERRYVLYGPCPGSSEE